MLSSDLYKLVIEEEKKNVPLNKLKIASSSVARAYSKKALQKGATYVNYNEPEYRCAYIYKYSNIHTRLVTKFFRKLSKTKLVKAALLKKRDIKICCLGGGPGTDIVGIFKALAIQPNMHQRISQVNVLDLCVGWHHSFNYIINNLVSGNVKDIPASFVKNDFKANFIEVDLLEPLPKHVIETVSNSDIICMVKFISAVSGKETFPQALKVLAHLFKVGTIILFIDNFSGNVAESMENISSQAGLEIVLGPCLETILNPVRSQMEIFNCEPQRAARVTVIGLIKKTESKIDISNLNYAENINSPASIYLNNGNSTANIDADCSLDLFCDKSTQTDDLSELSSNDLLYEKLAELSPLITALSELLSVVTQLQLNQQCCNCSCKNHAING